MTPEEARRIVAASGLIVKQEKPKKKPKKKLGYFPEEIHSELPKGVEWVTIDEALALCKRSKSTITRSVDAIHRFVNGRVICYYKKKDILCLKLR